MKGPNQFKGRFQKIDKELDKFLKAFFRGKNSEHGLSERLDSDKSDFSEEVKETNLLINSLQFKKYNLPDQDKEDIWNQIHNNINSPIVNSKIKTNKNPYYWVKIASVFIVLLTVASLFFIIDANSEYQVESTRFGETKTIKLPDGSEVVLNANSILKYKEENPRELWIQGEAFFSVVHTRDNRKFVVKTLDNLSVLVLGTTFNVYNREKKVKVVLNSGKIKLQREGKNSVDMSPGELAEFKGLDNYSITDVDPTLYTSWTHKKLIFKNTTVKELADLIEDTYGVKVTIPDKNLKDLKISGTLVNENLDGLLVGISETLDFKVIKTPNKITFKNRN